MLEPGRGRKRRGLEVLIVAVIFGYATSLSRLSSRAGSVGVGVGMGMGIGYDEEVTCSRKGPLRYIN